MSSRALVERVGKALVQARDQLNIADSVAGDGDLGNTAAAIGATLLELAAELDSLDPAPALRRVGLEIGNRAPSTFGTLLSMGLIAAARRLAEQPPDGPTRTLADVAGWVETAIATRGKASRGDKTLLDALGPADDALQDAAERNATPQEALSAAALAAESGVAATQDLEPKAGRQAWLKDRARGSVDAGALAIAIALRAAAGPASNQ